MKPSTSINPILPSNSKGITLKKQSWREINKARKEERKKWKQLNLEKKEKKKLEETTNSSTTEQLLNNIDTNPKVFSTVSIAVPGSILDNTQTDELGTYLAWQIARAASIFEVDEIIVYDDGTGKFDESIVQLHADNPNVVKRKCVLQLARMLQYLECPQYLRKASFPIHKDLRYTGLLHPLNIPHHFNAEDKSIYREGMVLNVPLKPGKNSQVNVGLTKPVTVNKKLKPNERCTVRLLPEISTKNKLKGLVVSPLLPRSDTGIYWGYQVRVCNSLSQVFSLCPYEEGYDLSIGTSDTGDSIDDFQCPEYHHLLVFFGGVQGIEAILENDLVLETDDPRDLFDYYLNTVPKQGTLTIRTEEAILVSLASIRPKLNPKYPLLSSNKN